MPVAAGEPEPECRPGDAMPFRERIRNEEVADRARGERPELPR